MAEESLPTQLAGMNSHEKLSSAGVKPDLLSMSAQKPNLPSNNTAIPSSLSGNIEASISGRNMASEEYNSATAASMQDSHAPGPPNILSGSHHGDSVQASQKQALVYPSPVSAALRAEARDNVAASQVSSEVGNLNSENAPYPSQYKAGVSWSSKSADAIEAHKAVENRTERSGSVSSALIAGGEECIEAAKPNQATDQRPAEQGGKKGYKPRPLDKGIASQLAALGVEANSLASLEQPVLSVSSQKVANGVSRTLPTDPPRTGASTT